MNSTDFSTRPPAGIFRRLFAIIYDLLLLAALSLGYGAFILIIRLIIEGFPEEGKTMSIPAGKAGFLILTGWWLVLASYFNSCWKKRGQTLAMKVWRLRLQQPDGSLATPKQRWNRCLIAPVSLCSGIGLLWCLIDKNGDCLHDKLTGTRVALLPKKVN